MKDYNLFDNDNGYLYKFKNRLRELFEFERFAYDNETQDYTISDGVYCLTRLEIKKLDPKSDILKDF